MENNKDRKEEKEIGTRNIIVIQSAEDLIDLFEAKKIVVHILDRLVSDEKIRQIYLDIVNKIAKEKLTLEELLAVSMGLHITASGSVYNTCLNNENYTKEECYKMIHFINLVFVNITMDFLRDMPNIISEMMNNKNIIDSNIVENLKKYIGGEYIQ